MLRKDDIQKQRMVTVIGSNYMQYGLVSDLLEKSFESYRKRDLAKKNFQVGNLENTYATAGIILTVLGIEAYRNRIYYFKKEKVKNVARDIASTFQSKKATFPSREFEELLFEVFVIRDVIVHNHIYEVNASFNKDWEMLSHRQKLLEGYGNNNNFKDFVNNRTRRTKKLCLNIQPAKIGFEELFTVLVMFDLFISISNKLLPNYYVPFNFLHKLKNKYANSLSEYLGYFYSQLSSKKFHSKLKTLLSYLETTFGYYLFNSYD